MTDFVEAAEGEWWSLDSHNRRRSSASFTQWSSVVQRVLLAALGILAAIGVALVLALRFRSSNDAASILGQVNDRVHPPVLVIKPTLASLHYCGLDPNNLTAMFKIPPLQAPGYDLVQVQAFIRHGTRFFDSPEECWTGQQNVYYNCSLTEMSIPSANMNQDTIHVPRIYRKKSMNNRDYFQGNCQLGQLTLKGFYQEKALGNMFRETYVPSLVTAELNPEEIFVRSHDMARTIMSAQAFISGMFPSKSGDFPPASIVDIWTMDVASDDEVANPHQCPGVQIQREQAVASPEFIAHKETITARLNERLSRVIGVPVDQLGTNVFDCLFVSLCLVTPVPEAIDLGLLHELEQDKRHNLYYMIQYPDRVTGSRLNIGPLLREISMAWNAVQTTPRFSVYSGHDSGPIMLLLSALGIEDDSWAPFASYISFEIYHRHDNQQSYARIIYDGRVRHIPTSVNGDGLIPLDQLQEYVKPMIPTAAECPGMCSPMSIVGC